MATNRIEEKGEQERNIKKKDRKKERKKGRKEEREKKKGNEQPVELSEATPFHGKSATRKTVAEN